MITAWLNLWKNTFNYCGKTTRKEYWLGLVANVIVMYILVVPYALILKEITESVAVAVTVYLIAVNLPVFSAFARRANDAGMYPSSTLFMALCAPIISGLLVGVYPSLPEKVKSGTLPGRLFAISFALFFYGGVLGIVLNGDPVSIPALPISGLLLASLTLIVYGIINWRAVLAFWGGN